MHSTHRLELKLSPLLSKSDKTGHIFTHLQSGSIIFIGQLCDDGCTATFKETHTGVKKNGSLVLEGIYKGVAVILHVHIYTNLHPSTTSTRQ